MFNNRSFARRIGKTLSTSRKNLLAQELPKFLFSQEKLNLIGTIYKKIILEIGFGDGVHLLSQSHLNQDTLFIGAEVYLNGVADFLKLAVNGRVSNILVWPDDIDLIFDQIPASYLSGVYILFPDPWPKRPQLKRRIFNELRFKIITEKLVSKGFLIFSSDIPDYFSHCENIIRNHGKEFETIRTSFDALHLGYSQTKYHNKALASQRTPRFLQAIKV